MKKNIILTIAILFLGFINISAQETVNVPVSFPKKEVFLKIGLINGSINIIGYKGKEVIVTGQNRRKRRNKYKRDGLKRVSSKTLSFTVEEYDNNVVVKSNSHGGKTTDFEIKVPYKCSLKLSTINYGEIIVNNVQGNIEVSNTNGRIKLLNISGSVSADALNQGITATFNSVTPKTPMAFSSLNGDIDVTFPKSLKANFKLKSDMGEIYTDFDLKTSAQKNTIKKNKSKDGRTYKVKVEKWVIGTVNGGGAELLFKNFNGDIIIRSK